MWKISEKLRKSLNAFRVAEPRSYARRFQSRPSIRRLEQRRVLNAEFSLDGSTLTLENFQNNVSDLTIANDLGGDYTITLSDGVWSESAGSDANSFTGAGTDTLTVDPADVLAMLVNDSDSDVDFGVLFDDPNFAGDTLELAGVGPVSQTGLAPMTFDTLMLDADGGNFEVPSLILAGDLVVENAANITDGVDTSLIVSGNASFLATNNITLANENSGGNELIVGGTASFASTNGDIRVGVEDGAADPSQGALANVQIGSIELITGGSFTVVSDNDLTEVSVDVDPSNGAEEYKLSVSGDPGFVFDITDNGDDLLVSEVDATITLSITTRSGDLQLGEVSVANELTLTALNGSILEIANDEAAPMQDLSAARINLIARNHIAGTGPGGPDGKLELSPGAVVTASSTEAGDIRLRGLGGLILEDIDTVDGSIDVMAGGAILATDVEANDATADISLMTTVDGITASRVDAERNVRMAAPGVILVNGSGVVAGDTSKLNSGDAITLEGAVMAAQVGLVAGTDITQNASGIVTTSELLVMAEGDAILDDAANEVGRVAADIGDGTAGIFHLLSTATLTVGQVTVIDMTITGVSSDTNADDATPGLIEEVKLTVIDGGNLFLTSGVQAATLGLMTTGGASPGAIAQTTAGVMTTGMGGLLVMSEGRVLLDIADNNVAIVAADVVNDTDATSGQFRLRSLANLAVGTVTNDGMTVTGVTAGEEAKVLSEASLTLNEDVGATTVFLKAGTDPLHSITQVGGALVRGTLPAESANLLAMAGGNVLLANPANRISAVHSAAGGVTRIATATDLTITALSTDQETITTPAPSSTMIVSPAMAVMGNAGGLVKYESPGSISVETTVTATQLGLVAGGNITETTLGRLITPELLVMAGGDVTLQQDNQVEEIAADVDGNFYFRTITNLVVGQVTIVTGPAVADLMMITGISSDGDTADGMVNASGDVKLQATQLGVLPADNRSLRLDHAIEAADALLIADETITQGAIGALQVDSVMLQAGGDVTLQNRNNVPVGVRGNLAPVLAADIQEGSLLFNTDTALTIDGLQFVAPDATTAVEGITILDAGTDQTFWLELSAAGDLRQDPIDPLLAMPSLRSRIDADVDVARFTVTPGSSISLADIDPTIATNRMDDVTYRQRTENRFFDDNAGSPGESQLVFETFTAGRIADLTLFDQTAVVLEDTDVVPDGTAIDITGDLTIIGGRSPETGLVPTGLAIGSTAAVKVAGEAQFHAIGGTGPTDQSINLPDLEINTNASGSGNLAVTTDAGTASLKNNVGFNFRDDLQSTIVGSLQVTTMTNAITDEAQAVITVAGLAEFETETLSEIFLGDGAARLDLNHVEIATLATKVSLHEENGITLRNIKVQESLYVSSAAGHILQDINQANETPFLVPVVSTKIEATSAAFSTPSGAVVLRDTAFRNLAVNSAGTFELTQQNLVGLPDVENQLARVDSSTLENPAGVDHLQPVDIQNGVVDGRDVDLGYAFFLGKNSAGNLTVGQAIADPATGAIVQGIRTPAGHVFLESAGDIIFNATGVAAAGSQGDPSLENVAVDIDSEFVLTAVANGQLEIAADTQLVSYESRLVQGSEELKVDGVVKVVHTSAAYQSFDGRLDPNDDTEDKAGPRFIITDPAPGFDAATSREVGRNPDGRILQRVQIDVGTAGEKGFFGDVLWADEVTGLVPDPAPSNRIDVAVVGERESLLVASLEKDAANNAVGAGDLTEEVFDATENSTTEKINLEHVFQEEFFVGSNANPNFPRLPTEIRVFNASSINLFAAGGLRNLNRSLSTEPEGSPAGEEGEAEALNPAREDNFVSPVQRIIGVPPDFQQIFIPLVPPTYVPVMLVSEDRPFALEKNDFDPPRVVDPQQGLVKYGFLGDDEELDEIESKTWPDGVTESFIQDIKEQVRQGDLIDFPLGDYIIRIERTEGGKVEEIRFKKTADQSGDGQPDIEDQVPVPGFDQNTFNRLPDANENDAQVSLPANSEESWVDAWRVWGAETQPLKSEKVVDPLINNEVTRKAENENARRLRHQRAVEQLNLSQAEQEHGQDLSLDWKRDQLTGPERLTDFVAGTSLVAGALVMAKYHGNARGNRWREAWTREVFSRWRR